MSTSILLQADANSRGIQALNPQSPVNVTISGTSQALAIPSDTSVVRVASTGNVYIEFGTSGATATTSSILFPAGVETFTLPLGVTHIAVIQVGAAAGVFGINRMK